MQCHGRYSDVQHGISGGRVSIVSCLGWISPGSTLNLTVELEQMLDRLDTIQLQALVLRYDISMSVEERLHGRAHRLAVDIVAYPCALQTLVSCVQRPRVRDHACGTEQTFGSFFTKIL